MQIILKRSGGLAGLRVTRTVDETALPARQARKMRRLVKAVTAAPRPGKQGASSGPADRFQYQLTVKERGRFRRLRFGEDSASKSLGALVAWLDEVSTKSYG